MTTTAYSNRPMPRLEVRAKGTAGELLKPGYAFFYRISETETAGVLPGGSASVTGSGETRSDTGSYREYEVEQCSLTNHEHPAGVMLDSSPDRMFDADGYADIEICPFSAKDTPGVEVWTDQSITEGDLLGAWPGSWALKRGVTFGQPLLRSIQTADRSSTNGLVRGCWSPTITDEEFERKHTYFFDDFNHFGQTIDATITQYTSSDSTAMAGYATQFRSTYKMFREGSSATGAVSDAAVSGGGLKLTPTATTDNAVVVLQRAAAFANVAGQPLRFEAVFTITEHNTDDANFLVGLVEFTTAALSATVPIGSNGAGPPSDYSGAVLFKVDGGTVWQAESSNSTSSGTQNTDTDCGAVTDGATIKLLITCDGANTWKFYIDGTLVHTASTSASNPLSTDIMAPVFGVKAGSATGTPNLIMRKLEVIQAKLNTQF